MAEDVAVLNAPAAAPAGGGDSGAGAPASPVPAATPTPAPAAAPAEKTYQSDEDILGIEPIGAPVKEQPAPVQKTEQQKADEAAAANAGKTPEQIAAEADAVSGDGRTIPEKWRELAKSDPEFRSLFFTSKANAEKLAAIEPQFTAMQTQIADVQRSDQAYLSGDPAAIAGELKTFVKDTPEALIPMLMAGESSLKELMPQEYARISSERLVTSLKEIGLDRGLTVLRNALEAGDAGNATLRAQVEKILEYFDGNGLPTTESARLAQQKAQLDARESSHKQSEERAYKASMETFRTSVNKEMETSIKSEIKTSLDKLLEKAAFTEGAKARISSDAYTEAVAILAQKPEIIEQIAKTVFQGGRGVFNDANRALAVRLPVEAAKAALPEILKKVIETYTRDFMASSQTQQTRSAAAGAKVEVSGGTPPARPPKPLTKKDVDYSKMNDDDILNA